MIDRLFHIRKIVEPVMECAHFLIIHVIVVDSEHVSNHHTVLAGAGNTKVANASASFKVEVASFRRSSDPRVVFVAAFAIEITAATANRVGNKSAPGREGGGRDARGIDATGGRRSFGRGS